MNQLKMLDEALVQLNIIERTIVEEIGNQLIKTLKKDSDALNELAEKIEKESEDLKIVVQKIGQAVNVVNSFIKVVTMAVSLGLA